MKDDNSKRLHNKAERKQRTNVPEKPRNPTQLPKHDTRRTNHKRSPYAGNNRRPANTMVGRTEKKDTISSTRPL